MPSMEHNFKKKLEEKILLERDRQANFEQTLEINFWKIFGGAVDRIDDVDDICQDRGHGDAVHRSELYIADSSAIVSATFFEHSDAKFTILLVGGLSDGEVKLRFGRDGAKTHRVTPNPSKPLDLEPSGVTELVESILEERVPAGFLRLTGS